MLDAGFDLNFIELREKLAFFDAIAILDQQLFHNSAGFGFHLNFGDGLDFASGDYALGEIAFFDFGEFGWINLRAATREGDDYSDDQDKYDDDGGNDDDAIAPLFASVQITVHICLLQSLAGLQLSPGITNRSGDLFPLKKEVQEN